MDERPRNWRDRVHKHVLSQNLDLFLRAFDAPRARQLRLETLTDRSAELIDDLPSWYGRIADVVAQVEAVGGDPRLLLIHAEIQRGSEASFGWRMLDYYTLLRRKTGLPVLPYALLLYPATPALGRVVYQERLLGQTVAQLAYRQISLPCWMGGATRGRRIRWRRPTPARWSCPPMSRAGCGCSVWRCGASPRRWRGGR